MKSFDVIIIGAGPAGAISSYYLSKKGLEVCLIDKKNLGKDKICGGGISNYALSEIPFKLPPNIIERNINGFSFITPNDTIFSKKENQIVGATVYRNRFDSYLLKKSMDANTTFIPDTNVRKIKQNNDNFVINEKYKCPYLIGADGANSFVKNKFSIGPKQENKYLGLRAILTLKDNEVERYITHPNNIDFYFKNGLRGYGWVFPLKEALNIGVGILGNKGTKITKDLVKYFALNRFKIPKKYLPELKIEGFPIPVKKLPRRFSKNNVFLIGDAAGLVDPVNGEGIHYAIKSGKIVADTIIKDHSGLLHGDSELHFRQNLEKLILADLRISYKLRSFLDHFVMVNMDIWFKLLKRNPFIFNYTEELSNGSSYHAIYRDVLKNLPSITLNTVKGNNNIPGLTSGKK